ncbi:MAG TPA: hypothetical protein VF553_13370 [Pyrinomonadaceae bacterium]|jgi:hypothetical protein
MNRHQDSSAINQIISLTTALALLLILSAQAQAQRGAPVGSSPNMDRSRESGVREHQRQLQVLLNSREPGEPGNQARLNAIIEQTKQDFDRIQVLNRELVGTATASDALNYRSLTEMAAEIRKRARRLKDNISLPPPTDDQALKKIEGELSREELKAALLMLSNHIVSFATNPLFQTSNVIDARLGARASRDLELIINLSAQIKKTAERLSKTSR